MPKLYAVETQFHYQCIIVLNSCLSSMQFNSDLVTNVLS